MTKSMSQKSPSFFVCEYCDYSTSNKKDYNKHILTRKHLNTKNYKENGIKIPKNRIFACECGKTYPYQGSLYNHKKKCSYNSKYT